MAALKGAFINLGAGLLGTRPVIVVFQFNPDRMTRTPALVQPPPPANGAGSRDTHQQPGLPTETYSFTLRLDATDQLARRDSLAMESGILPMLSALELLMVPQAALLLNLFGGGPKPYQFSPTRLPAVLFVWGPYRVLPVAITNLSINETEYDPLLNPVRAEVTVSLTVLTPSQLPTYDILARGAYIYSAAVKEDMAVRNRDNAATFGVSAHLSF